MSKIQQRREEFLQRKNKTLEELPEAISKLKPLYQYGNTDEARFIREIIEGLIDSKAVVISDIYKLDALNCEAIITILRAMSFMFGDVRPLLIKEFIVAYVCAACGANYGYEENADNCCAYLEPDTYRCSICGERHDCNNAAEECCI